MINSEKKLWFFFFPITFFFIALMRAWGWHAFSENWPEYAYPSFQKNTEIYKINNLAPWLTKQTIWYVRPAKTHISIGKEKSQVSPGIYPV